MVKIQNVGNKFILNSKNNTLTSNIIYDDNFDTDKNNIKKIKLSCLFNCFCTINEKNLFFSSRINFNVIDNGKSIYLCNVSIIKINITDSTFQNIIECDNDDIENMIYNLIETIFLSCFCSKNFKNNKYCLSFTINKNFKINDSMMTIEKLLIDAKIGIFLK